VVVEFKILYLAGLSEAPNFIILIISIDKSAVKIDAEKRNADLYWFLKAGNVRNAV